MKLWNLGSLRYVTRAIAPLAMLLVANACESTVPSDALGLLGTIKQDASRAATRFGAHDGEGARRECSGLKEEWKKLRNLKDSAILSFKTPGFDIPNEDEIRTLSVKLDKDINAFCDAIANHKAPDPEPLKNELANAEDLAQRYAPLCGASGGAAIAVVPPSLTARAPAAAEVNTPDRHPETNRHQ